MRNVKNTLVFCAFILGILFLSAWTSRAWAITVVSNVSEASSGQESVYYVITTTPNHSQSVAGSFVAGAAAKLIDVKLLMASSPGGSTFSVSLSSDNNG